MRKITVFGLFILVLFLFSCNFQLPTALEVTGNPNFRFAAKKDIGETFANMVPQIGNEYQLIKCVNTITRTYIIRSELLEEGFTLPDKFPSNLNDDFTTKDDERIGGRDLTIKINFDTVLSGFSLKPVNAQVFIYGDTTNQQLVDILAVKINIDASDDNYDNEYTRINKMKSGINDIRDDENNMISTVTSLPGSSVTNIPLPLGKNDLYVEFEVYVPAGATVNQDWFDGNIHTEILIWVPLEFIASGETEGVLDEEAAVIKIPPGLLFPAGQDLFGRSAKDDANPVDEFIDSLELSIILNQNPFEDRNLIIWSGSNYEERTIEIHNIFKGNAFSFAIDEETMTKINNPDNHPFVPNFRIEYETGEDLAIPWEIKSTEFVFKAKINYRKEF